jgi:hypothetical protein
MLWELTLTFNVLRPEAAAAILVGFVAVASVLAWKQDRSPALSVAYLSSIAAAFALALGTHALLPYTAVILTIVALCEVNAVRARLTGARILAVLAADGMIWAVLFIYTGLQTSRANYPPLGSLALVAPALILFSIVFVAVAAQTAFLRKPISPFEAVQTTIAFALAAAGIAWLVPSGLMFLGWTCLGLAIIVSVTCVRVFAGSEESRNYYVFSWWAFALFFSGAILGIPLVGQITLLSAGALCLTALGVRMRRPILEYQGLLLLLLVAAISGAPRFVSLSLLGTLPGEFSWSLFMISATAAVSYAMQQPTGEETWRVQVLRLVTAFLIVSALAALLVKALVSLIDFAVAPGPHHIALIRTAVLCFIALMLAFSGRRWRRVELTRISYGALVFVTVKLLVEDLRNPRLLFIAASIFLVATTLLVVPRLSRLPRSS